MSTEDPTTTDRVSTTGIVVAAVATLAAGYGLFKFASYVDGKGDALLLSLVVLVGLGLVIALMAGLATIYWILGVQNNLQPLALPEGSVRALLSFSLLLIFVCLATFLYQGTKGIDLVVAGKVTRITAAQIEELRKDFVVVAEAARKTDGTLEQDPGTPPTTVFNATYYNRVRSKEADDLAKQIFTTLATVFVSVVSFYFGSSATSSGVGAGLKAATGDSKPPLDKTTLDKPSHKVPANAAAAE
jgi:hypothetical protein